MSSEPISETSLRFARKPQKRGQSSSVLPEYRWLDARSIPAPPRPQLSDPSVQVVGLGVQRTEGPSVALARSTAARPTT